MGRIFPGLVPLLFPSNRASDIPRKWECDGRPTIKPRPAWRGHDEDKLHGIDNSPPLISQAHDWKGFHPSHRNISVDERMSRRAILLVVCAPLSSLRQSAAFCWVLPKQPPTPLRSCQPLPCRGHFPLNHFPITSEKHHDGKLNLWENISWQKNCFIDQKVLSLCSCVQMSKDSCLYQFFSPRIWIGSPDLLALVPLICFPWCLSSSPGCVCIDLIRLRFDLIPLKGSKWRRCLPNRRGYEGKCRVRTSLLYFVALKL